MAQMFFFYYFYKGVLGLVGFDSRALVNGKTRII